MNRAELYNKAFPNYPPLCTSGRWVYGIWMLGQNYKGSGYHGCLSPTTKILTSNLKWIYNRDIHIGDKLVGVTEYTIGQAQRKLEIATVLDIGNVILPSFKIGMDNGKEFIASNNHLWLIVDKYSAIWKRTDELLVGDNIRKIIDPWDQPKLQDAGWLGGILDGEGCIDRSQGFRISITQNPGVVLNEIVKILDKWSIIYIL